MLSHSRLKGFTARLARSLSLFVVIVCTGRGAGVALGQEVDGGGAISGTIIETFNESPLGGVAVTIRGTTLGTRSDAGGHYLIESVPPGRHELRFAKPGYERTAVGDVAVIAGQKTRADARVSPEFFEAETFEVIADPEEEQMSILLEDRKMASMFTDAIGSDMFKNLGIGDAAEAVGKVTGASVADGKYAVIRGLADRYTFTTLNGTDLPSADPDRKAFQLDLLPSGFIRQVDVSKTFTPDMSGGFAGGAINIIPESYPEEEFFSFKTGVSYNTNAGMRDDFLVNDRGSSDWLAMDDGTRELPAELDEQPQSGPLDQSVRGSFGSDHFTPREGDSYVGSSYSLGYGNSHSLFGGRAGYLLSMSYKNDYNHYDKGNVRKYESFIFNPDGTNLTADKTDRRSVVESTWAALANLGYEINDNHEIGFTVLHVQTGEDEARILQGFEDNVVFSDDQYLDQRIMHWTERELDYMQLRGGHELPDFHDIRFDWAGSLASTSQDEPDHRVFQMIASPSAPSYVLRGPLKPQLPVRFWREVLEDNSSARADMTIPLPSYNEKDNLIKTGGAFSRSDRDFSQRAVQYNTSSGLLPSGNPNDLLDPGNPGLTTTIENYAANVEYRGEQNIDSYYGMAEWAAFEWFRLVGGARVETTEITLNGFNHTLETPIPSAPPINEVDVLPSLSGTVFFREDLQLRAAWSETVIRPTYREIGAVELYDLARTRIYIGNPELELSHSKNYDLRLDWFPREGEIVSASVFHKEITSPIEQSAPLLDNTTVTFENFGDATVSGVEFEARLRLDRIWEPLKSLTLGANGAYIYSEVPLTSDQMDSRRRFGDTATTRPLYDQPEYIANLDLTWDMDRTKTSVTVSGGIVGERLTVVGLATPDEIIAPAPELNFFIRQKVGENWDISFSAKNLLDPEIETFQSWPKAGEKVLTTYTKGVTFGLSVSCRF